MPHPSKATAAAVAVLAVALLAAPACRRDARNQNPDTTGPASTPSASATAASAFSDSPAPSAASTADHAEVFRRAFWRHPTTADRVLQAERRVNPADSSWSWFIQLHPSPELLASLRDPETFGLRSPGAPGSSPAPTLASPPAWFPAQAERTSTATASAGFEILQAPASGLVVLYRASDNLLFATDTGTGFAPPAR